MSQSIAHLLLVACLCQVGLRRGGREPLPTYDLRYLLDKPTRVAEAVKNPAAPRLPLIRRYRVIALGRKKFACGACGKSFSSQEPASACVAACFTKEATEIRIHTNACHQHVNYSCPFCLRTYANAEDADLCRERCHETVISELPAHALALAAQVPILNATDNSEPSVDSERGLPARNLEQDQTKGSDNKNNVATNSHSTSTSLKAPLSKEDLDLLNEIPLIDDTTLDDLDFATTTDEDIGHSGNGQLWLKNLADERAKEASAEDDFAIDVGASSDPSDELVLTSEADSEAKPAAPSNNSQQSDFDLDAALQADENPSSDSTSNVDPGLVRRPGMAPFIRDGARYVCTVCQKKFFTKKEVETCFNSHPFQVDDEDDEEEENAKEKGKEKTKEKGKGH